VTEQDSGDRLAQAWEAIRRGEPLPADLDAWLVETLHDLHARDHVPPLDPTFVRTLREDLMSDFSLTAGTSVEDLIVPNGHVAVLPRPTPWLPAAGPRSRHWSLGQLAKAAIILLTLISSVVAFGPGLLSRQEQQPAFLPAINATPEAIEGVSTETLLDTTISALPTGKNLVIFKRLILQPSPKSLTVLPLTGPVFMTVASGELTATTDGTEHRLAAGDRFSPEDPEQETDLRATGTEAAVVYLVYFQHGPDLPFPRDVAIHDLQVLVGGRTDEGVACPCRLVLEQVTVLPGAALPPQVADPLTWFAFEQGEVGLTGEGDRLPYPLKSEKERTFHVGEYVPIDRMRPGTVMTLRNVGDDPLILDRLTLTPAETGASTPTP
jgi:hypothetical protein